MKIDFLTTGVLIEGYTNLWMGHALHTAKSLLPSSSTRGGLSADSILLIKKGTRAEGKDVSLHLEGQIEHLFRQHYWCFVEYGK